MENQSKWDNAVTNPGKRHNFKYWSPRFYVIHNNDLLVTDTGIDGWKGTIQPTLTKLVG